MVQPYLSAVDTVGETALLFMAGPDGLAYSHAIRKGPMLTGPDLQDVGLFKEEEITAPGGRRRASGRSPSARWPPYPVGRTACSTRGST